MTDIIAWIGKTLDEHAKLRNDATKNGTDFCP